MLLTRKGSTAMRLPALVVGVASIAPYSTGPAAPCALATEAAIASRCRGKGRGRDRWHREGEGNRRAECLPGRSIAMDLPGPRGRLAGAKSMRRPARFQAAFRPKTVDLARGCARPWHSCPGREPALAGEGNRPLRKGVQGRRSRGPRQTSARSNDGRARLGSRPAFRRSARALGPVDPPCACCG